MREAFVKDKQSVWDLSIEHYGSVDGLLQLLKDNPQLDLETSPVAGTKILIDESAVVNKLVADEFARQRYSPATGVDVTECHAFTTGFSKGFR